MSAKGLAPIRVLVADNHKVVRTGMRVMLAEINSYQRFELEEAETSEEAVAKVETGNFRVVLIEYHLPGRGGPKATQMILARRPEICVLGMAYQVERSQVEKMLAAGAKGFILTGIEPDTLVTAIRSVMNGRKFFSNEVALQWMDKSLSPTAPNQLERLTKREKEILRMILEGLKGREIGQRIHISNRTVDKHRQNLMRKLGASNAVELVQAGLRLGMVNCE